MSRLLIVAVVSLLAFFPAFVIAFEVFNLNEDYSALLAIAVSWCLLPWYWLKKWSGKPDILTLQISQDDPIMRESEVLAKQNLSRFIQGVKDSKDEASVRFHYQFGDDSEVLWGPVHKIEDNSVYTSVDDYAETTQQIVRLRRKIALDDVLDWMLTDEQGRSQGGYSMLATAKIYQQRYGRLPKPYIDELTHYTDFSFEPLPPEKLKDSAWPLILFLLTSALLVLAFAFGQPGSIVENRKEALSKVRQLVTFNQQGLFDDFDYQQGFGQAAVYPNWQDAIFIDGQIDNPNFTLYSQKELAQLLENKAFVKLDDYFSRMHGLYLEKRLPEWGFNKLLWRLGFESSLKLDAINTWQAATGSEYAYLAEALTLQEIAWDIRGSKGVRNTSNAQLGDFKQIMMRSKEPALTALNLNLKIPLSYEALFAVRFADKYSDELVYQWLTKLEEYLPQAFYPRARLMLIYSPRWGGSVENIRALALRAQSFIEANSELRCLLGYEWYTRARNLSERGYHREAIAVMQKALFHGRRNDWLNRYGYDLYQVERYDEARKVFKESLAIVPTNQYAQRMYTKLQ